MVRLKTCVPEPLNLTDLFQGLLMVEPVVVVVSQLGESRERQFMFPYGEVWGDWGPVAHPYYYSDQRGGEQDCLEIDKRLNIMIS